MINKNKLIMSLVLGCLVTAAAFLPVAFAESLLTPGAYLAAPVWPEGTHSGNGLSAIGLVGFFSVVWLGSVLAWSIVSYAAISIFGRLRGA